MPTPSHSTCTDLVRHLQLRGACILSLLPRERRCSRWGGSWSRSRAGPRGSRCSPSARRTLSTARGSRRPWPERDAQRPPRALLAALAACARRAERRAALRTPPHGLAWPRGVSMSFIALVSGAVPCFCVCVSSGPLRESELSVLAAVRAVVPQFLEVL